MDTREDIEELIITRQEYAVAFLLEQGAVIDDVRLDCHLESGMMQMILAQKLPCKILQNNEIIYRVPSNNWQLFKSYLGLKHRTTVIYLNEHVTFPKYAWPSKLGEHRIYIQHGLIKGLPSDVCEL